MNLIELLMAEHASLRVYFRHLRYLNSDFLFELDDFVTNCHARIEDEVLFPEIRAAVTVEREVIENWTKRMEDEHQLLKMLGDKMRLLVAEGNRELDRDKVALYADTLESHNSSEEALIFPRWSAVSGERANEATIAALKILHEFGTERYLRVTGFSQQFLSFLEPKKQVPVARRT
jgi:hemerythrin superfamily protein